MPKIVRKTFVGASVIVGVGLLIATINFFPPIAGVLGGLFASYMIGDMLSLPWGRKTASRPIQDCTREKDHDGPCNGWPCIICLHCRDTKGAHRFGVCQDGTGRWFLPLHRGNV